MEFLPKPEKLSFKDDICLDKYCGYANYQTYSVSLFIDSYDELQSKAKDFALKGLKYKDFAQYLYQTQGVTETIDGVALNDTGVNIDAINEEFFDPSLY